MANTLNIFFSIAFIALLTSCSGTGGKVLTFLSGGVQEPTYGSVVASSPNEINNLITWFKADGLMQGSANSLSTLSEWPSSIANGPALIVPVDLQGPVVASWGESQSALKFSGNSSVLKMDGFSLGSFETFSIVLVIKALSPGMILSFGSDLNSTNDSGALIASNEMYQIKHITTTNTDYNVKNSLTMDTSAAHIVVATFSASSDWRDNQIFIDGFRSSESIGAENGVTMPFVSLVRHLTLGGLGGDFLLAEVAVYGRQLSPRDAYSVSKGLGEKWKIPVDQKITKEIFDDKIDTGIKEITYESLKRDIFATKGCLGCHNSSLKSDGIDLSTYSALKSGVSSSSSKRLAIPGQGASSGLYTSIVGTVPQMPKIASSFGGYLSNLQTQSILTWINSGMKENENSIPLPAEGGTPPGGEEDPTQGHQITLFEDVYYGIINTKCLSCHNTTTKNGGVDLSTYLSTVTSVNLNAEKLVIPRSPTTSRLYQVVSGIGLSGGTATMPSTGIFLSTAEQDLIKKWITDGALQDGVSITSGPSGFVNSASSTFEFIGTASTGTTISGYECSLDNETYTPCISPLALTGISMGNHSMQIRFVTDTGIRSAPSAASWTVDTAAPTISLTSNQALLSKNASITFTFSAVDVGLANGITYTCKMDANVATICAAGVKTYTPLTAGSHTFILTATDLAGNTATSSYTWLIDGTAPTVTLTSLNTGTYARSSSQTITWTASDANGLADFPVKLEYTLDGTNWTVIVAATENTLSYPWTLPATASTTFKIRISVTDKAGNIRVVTSSGNMTLN